MNTKNLPVNRHALLSNRPKLWCPDCQTLRVVCDFFNVIEEAKLACGHRRKMDVVKAAQSVAVLEEVACPKG
jgi:hypothetical protein